MNYFEEDTQLQIFSSPAEMPDESNKTLHHILEAVYRMAVRKRKANQQRTEGEKYKITTHPPRFTPPLPIYLCALTTNW